MILHDREMYVSDRITLIDVEECKVPKYRWFIKE